MAGKMVMLCFQAVPLSPGGTGAPAREGTPTGQSTRPEWGLHREELCSHGVRWLPPPTTWIWQVTQRERSGFGQPLG